MRRSAVTVILGFPSAFFRTSAFGFRTCQGDFAGNGEQPHTGVIPREASGAARSNPTTKEIGESGL